MLKCQNWSMETEVWKWEEKPPGPLARHSCESVHTDRLLSSHFHTSIFILPFSYTSVSILQHFPLSWAWDLFHTIWSVWNVEHACWGWGDYSCDVRGDITVAGRILQTCRTCKTEIKLLSVIALSVNQEINKINLKPYHMAYNIKTGIHHKATLGLLILLKLEIQQNWNFTTWHLWICWFAKTENTQNWNFTTRYLWSYHSCGPAYW